MAHGSSAPYGTAMAEHGSSAFHTTTAGEHGFKCNNEGGDAFELGDDCGDGTEILGSAGLCIGGSDHYMVVQAADEEAAGRCF